MSLHRRHCEQFSRKDLPEWQQKVLDAYPLLYLEHDDQIPYPQEAPCNLRFGFEFGRGWIGLVEEFSQAATDLIVFLRTNGIQADAYIHSCIFKEKFGLLRWQGRHNLIEPLAPLFDGFKHSIEHRSSFTCEVCGMDGTLYEDGSWARVRCKKDREK